MQKDDTDCVKMLLASGASVNAPLKENADGVTALYVMGVRGNEGSTRALLRAGANRLASVGAGATAVHVAAQNGHTGVLKLLLDNSATSTDSEETAEMENSMAIVTDAQMQSLVAAKMRNGVFATYLAAQNGKTACLALLLDAKADVHSPVPDGSTCLHAAVQGGHNDCVRLLLQRGGKVTQNQSCRNHLSYDFFV